MPVQLSFLTPEVLMARGRNVRVVAPKRRLFWVRKRSFKFPGDGAGNAFRTNLLDQFEEEYGAQLFGFTVTRIRGHLSVWPQSTEDFPVGTPVTYSAGIRVVDDAAIEQADTDETHVPLLPMQDHHADWMWLTRETIMTPPDFVGAGQPFGVMRHEIDVKAQRRIDELGQGLYALSGNSGIDEAPLSYDLDLSILMKRP